MIKYINDKMHLVLLYNTNSESSKGFGWCQDLWSLVISPDLARSRRKGSSLLRLLGHTIGGSKDNDSLWKYQGSEVLDGVILTSWWSQRWSRLDTRLTFNWVRAGKVWLKSAWKRFCSVDNLANRRCRFTAPAIKKPWQAFQDGDSQYLNWTFITNGALNFK